MVHLHLHLLHLHQVYHHPTVHRLSQVYHYPTVRLLSSSLNPKKILVPDGALNDGFGLRVGILGDTVAVGGKLVNDDNVENRGAIYLFAKNDTSLKIN